MQEFVSIFISFLKNNLFIFSSLVFWGSFLLVYFTIPKVIYVAYIKKLTAPIIHRSSHSRSIPSLAGVAFFMSFIIFISLIQLVFHESTGYNIIAALAVLFMIGLKDDLINSSAKVKLYGQLLASLFIIFSPAFHITNLNGFLGIYYINPLLSIVIAVFFLTFIINAFNLIDGIDGLAASVGIVSCSTFMILFYIKEEYFFFLLCVLTISILLAFLRFNLSSGKLKIFMGDCGSLVIGMILGVCTLHYLSSPVLIPAKRLFLPENRVLFTTAVLFIPIFDTVRVIIIRLLSNSSPFKADRNHLHHILLDQGMTHRKATLSLLSLNIFVIAIFFIVSNKLPNFFVFLFMLGLYLAIALLFYKLKNSNVAQLKKSQS
jgi:UDP-N-acetylmuramyl pentapeptide phosphotransferase/UDP-N-acetylglucosamine-1-phosphate transferase